MSFHFLLIIFPQAHQFSQTLLSKHSSPKIKWYQLTDDIITNTMSWLGCWKILNSVSLTNSEQINNYQNFFFFKGFWVDPRAFQHPPVKQVLKYNNCFKTSTDNWPFLLLLVLLNILVKHFLVCTTNKKLTYPCNMDCTPEENQRMDFDQNVGMTTKATKRMQCWILTRTNLQPLNFYIFILM